jgi:hypothetical protein
MHDDSILTAIDDALRGPAYCSCGKSLTVNARDAGIWLECHAYERPTRLPAPLALFIRDLGHERRLLIELPTDTTPAPMSASVSSRTTIPVRV